MDFSNEFIAVFSTNYIECQKQKNKIIQQKPSVKIFLDLQIPSLDPFCFKRRTSIINSYYWNSYDDCLKDLDNRIKIVC